MTTDVIAAIFILLFVALVVAIAVVAGTIARHRAEDPDALPGDRHRHKGHHRPNAGVSRPPLMSAKFMDRQRDSFKPLNDDDTTGWLDLHTATAVSSRAGYRSDAT